MFDLFSWSHILILLVVALVVVGPKDLPRLMRTAGQWAGKARAMANEFRRSFDEMARQSELDELRKEIESLRNERPLATIERDFNESILPPEHRSVPPDAAFETAAVEETQTPGEPTDEPAYEPEPPIDHDRIDDEPAPPDPEHAADVVKGPPAP